MTEATVTAPTPLAFGAVLRTARERVGIAQSRLARAAGLSPSLLNMLESGERRSSRDQVLRLAAAMGLDQIEADDLLAAGGHLPAAYDTVPPDDADVLLLVRMLADPALTDAERTRLRLTVRLACSTWRPEAFDLSAHADERKRR